MKGLIFASIIILTSCFPKNLEKQTPVKVEQAGDRDRPVYSAEIFKSVPNDPLNVRMATLKNGLKVYLTVNKEEPRIQTQVSVKAGGKNDPSYATGLAHYLEHLLFKGTDSLGTVDFEKEKVELEKIKALYEVYRTTTDSLKRKEIYRSIDSIAQVAAQYVCLNEFDQSHSVLGATGTNAFTTHDNTSYVTNIPSNQLKDWVKLEFERFRSPVLRLFHTELETVYEEKNRSQDNHFRQAYYAMLRALFKKHNYGLQTTIGTIEHLKNPSIVEIEQFYNNYYVPNNMAIILSGDFNPDSALAYIKSTFGQMEPAAFDNYLFEPENPLDSNEIIHIKAPDAPSLLMGYRLPKANSEEVLLARMLDMILNNSKAGLIDLNINQKQKAVGVYSGISTHADYSYHILGGSPTKGQSLEELRSLILEQIEKVQKGDFPDWLIPAIVNDFKIRELKALQSNDHRVSVINTAFVHNIPWQQQVMEMKIMEAINKQMIVEFANSHWYKHHVAVFKEQTDEVLSRKKVDKPDITPLDIPADNQSEFLRKFIKNNNPQSIQPDFINYKEAVHTSKLANGSELLYTKNESDELFNLTVIYPMGAYHNKNLELAAKQVKLLGTDKFSAEELSQEMYKIGMSYSFGIGQKESSITLSGLTTNLDTSLSLLNHIIDNIQPNDTVSNALIQKTLQQRDNETHNPKSILWNGLMNYAVYGKFSPLRDELSNEALQELKSKDLLVLFKDFVKIKPVVLFYGELPQLQVSQKLNKSFIVNGNQLFDTEVAYERLDHKSTKFILLDYDLKQSDILLLNKSTTFKKSELAVNSVFNQYYGGGMSSVVFQEIREKKALVYQAFAIHTAAKDTVTPQYTYGYLGCQTDKTIEAINSMFTILDTMPQNEEKFNQAKSSILQELATTRITRSGKLSSYWNNKKLGFESSKNELLYNSLQSLTFQDVVAFHKENVANRPFTIAIVANLKDLDVDRLLEMGTVEVVSVKDLYPY